MATNLELAKRIAEFADTLAHYNHLPPLGFVCVPPRGVVRAQPDMALDTPDRVAAIGQWADAFRVAVLLDLTDMAAGDVRVSATVELGGRQTLLYVVLLTSQYRAFEPGLGLGELRSGEETQVSARQLLTALTVKGEVA